MIIEATSLYRVISCNGSIALTGQIVPVSAPPTEDAREGTAAHFVATAVLSGMVADPVDYIGRQTPNGVFITSELAELIHIAIKPIQERLTLKSHVESNTDFEPTPGVFIHGRTDHWQYDPVTQTLYIDDYKFGWRIVEPYENWTLLAYALGVCIKHGLTPVHVVLTIHQPRPHHSEGKSREWTITSDQLSEYGSRIAFTLRDIKDELVSGPHCDGCPALGICRAATLAGFNAIDVSVNTVVSQDISDAELSAILPVLERAAAAIEALSDAYQEIAKHRIQKGVIITDYALEMRLGNRRFLKHITPEFLEAISGKEVTERKLITPAEFQRQSGIDDDALRLLTERPSIGAKLIRQNANRAAKKLFGATPPNSK